MGRRKRKKIQRTKLRVAISRHAHAKAAALFIIPREGIIISGSVMIMHTAAAITIIYKHVRLLVLFSPN